MDPATHLVLPLLILLAARQDPRLVIPLSIFAILPDLDSVVGIHRATFHNIFLLSVIPLIFLLYARLKRPDLLLPGLIVLFYLSSHIVIDLGGIALLYPFYDQAFYFEPTILFQTRPHLDFDINLEYGVKELTEKSDYTFVSELGFAYIFLGILLAVVFRREFVSGMKRCTRYVKELIQKIRKRS